jgi:hypothetical protein
LEKATQDPLLYQEHEPPPTVIVAGEEENEVKWVDNSWLFRRQLQNLVKWRGYDERCWEPAANVDGLKAIDDFHMEKPGKSGL